LSHWGYRDTPFPYDGRQVVLPRPRVRTSDKKREVQLPIVRQLQDIDPMAERVVEQLLLGVSTRGYEQSLGPQPANRRARGAKKSNVSEMFIEETKRRMREHFAEKLDHLDLVAMLLDGLNVGGHAIVVGLGISREGTKHVLGLRQSSTENKVLCTELLQEFVGRGLKDGQQMLFVIDGGRRSSSGSDLSVERCDLD
jgi:hypothetical protein